MAKRKADSIINKLIGKKSRTESIKDFFRTIKEELKEASESFIHSLNEARFIFRNAERRVMRKLFSFFLLLAGLIFLSISFVFLAAEYFNLSRGWGLLIVGAALLIFSFMLDKMK